MFRIRQEGEEEVVTKCRTSNKSPHFDGFRSVHVETRTTRIGASGLHLDKRGRRRIMPHVQNSELIIHREMVIAIPPVGTFSDNFIGDNTLLQFHSEPGRIIL